MCDVCEGTRYCAYDHSESKYFGKGMNGVREENTDCWFLEEIEG
jgi:hypothetical protein